MEFNDPQKEEQLLSQKRTASTQRRQIKLNKRTNLRLRYDCAEKKATAKTNSSFIACSVQNNFENVSSEIMYYQRCVYWIDYLVKYK